MTHQFSFALECPFELRLGWVGVKPGYVQSAQFAQSDGSGGGG